MNPRLFLLLCLLLQASFASGQSYRVEGLVRDSLGQGIPYCTVSVLTASDSVVVTGTSSDDSGRYTLQLPHSGSYLLRYEHLAYDTETRPLAVPGAEPLPDVVLRPSSHTLDEVVVAAQYTKYRAGRYECNLLGSPLVRNRTVSQLLDLLPGVNLVHGELKIKGKPVSVIYIDDREVTNRAELSALSADRIRSVEVENTAGSDYAATTTGGVIRIRLKELSAGSFYGNVAPSVTVTENGFSTQLSVPFAAQYKNLGIYNYVQGAYGEGKTLERTRSEFRNTGQLLASEDSGWSRSWNIHELLSLVYDIDDRNTLGVGGQLFFGRSDPSNRVYTTTSALNPDAASPLPEQYTLYRYGGEVFNRQYQASLNYVFRFDSLASKLTFKASYLHRNVDRNYDYDTRDYRTPEDAEPFASELRRERYEYLGHSVLGRLDLTKNFSDVRTLRAGLRYDLWYADNDNCVHKLRDGQWVLDPQTSMQFLDHTQSGAAYAIWENGYRRFAYSVGVRFQWDRISYRNAGDTGYDHRDYWRLFPELSLSYTFNEEKGTNINLDLSRYSDRLPDNDDLSPRRVWQSQYSYYVGNERLEPGWGYDIDLSYTLRSKLTFNYGFTWSQGSARMTFFDPDDPNVVYTMPVNGEHGTAHNLWIGYNTPVTEWLRLNAFVHGYWYRSKVDGDWEASYSAGGGNASLGLHFQLLPTMELRVAAYGELPQKRLEIWQNGSVGLSAGISKSFCKNKLYVSLDVNNIVMTRLRQTTTRWDGSYHSVFRQLKGGRNLSCMFSLSYNFSRNVRRGVMTVDTLHQTEEVNR